MNDVVWVHNTAFTSQSAWQAEPPMRRRDIASWAWWNIWRRRAIGWDLGDGDPVVLCSSWPKGGRLEWLVTAADVVTWIVPDWSEATRSLAEWSGDHLRAVRAEAYTASKTGVTPCYVLAWRARATRLLAVDKPQGLKIGRNGWVKKDAAWLASVMGTAPPPTRTTRTQGSSPKGQGRRQLAAANKAVETRAVAVAKAWCRRQGWIDIKDTGSTKPWDLEATTRSGTTRYVEVKGLTGGMGKVEVTSGEVRAAQKHGNAHVMVVVHSIDLDLRRKPPVASGGVIEAFSPWRPNKSELRETRYDWLR